MTALIISGIALALIFIFMAASYVKAPPNVAYVITGFKKEPRIISGRATIMIPFFERIDKIPLDLIQIDVQPSQEIPTAEFINIEVDGVANVQIEDIQKASTLLLGRDPDNIRTIVREVLEGNMREIIGQMKLVDLVKNRDEFAAKVSENAREDMQNMGIKIVNLVIQNFTDRNDVLHNLGIDNVEQIRKDAQIAKANAAKDIQIAEAEARKVANDAKVLADLDIAQKQTELELKKAELKVHSDTEKAKADAAYEIQKNKMLKDVNAAAVEAQIAKTEKETSLELARVKLEENRLEAEIKKAADAVKYKAEMETLAKKFEAEKNAEAKKFARLQEAEARKAEADALRYTAEQEAEGIRAKGLAEAEAIEKRAEAMAKMDEAAKMQLVLDSKVIPEAVAAASEPLKAVGNITMYGDGNTGKMVGGITENISKVLSGIKDATGIDLASFLVGKMAGSNDNT